MGALGSSHGPEVRRRPPQVNNVAFPSARLGDFDFHILQKGKLTQTGPLRLARAHSTALTQTGISTQISRATVSVSGI